MIIPGAGFVIFPVAFSGPACDPYWNNVVLAMHMDGANGSTTFTDGKGHTVTAYGDVEISTVESKFGGASTYFDGASYYLAIDSSPDFDFVSDTEWSVWINPSSLPVAEAAILNIDGQDGSHAAHRLSLTSSGNIYCAFMYDSNPASLNINITSSDTVTVGVWTLVTVTKNGNTVKLFFNGVEKASGTASGAIEPWVSGRKIYIGKYYHPSFPHYFHGYIDDLRITKGVARYTSDFTPPTAAFAEVAC